MLRDRVFAAAIAGLFSTAMINNNAFAQRDLRSPEERRAAEDTNVGLTEAIRTAEQEAGGRAVEIDFEYEGRMTIYEIDVLRDGRTYKVYVDTQTVSNYPGPCAIWVSLIPCSHGPQ
jgi:uncharacterized membrane protein YkoI